MIFYNGDGASSGAGSIGRIKALDVGSYKSAMAFEVSNQSGWGDTTTERMRITNTGVGINVGGSSIPKPLTIGGGGDGVTQELVDNIVLRNLTTGEGAPAIGQGLAWTWSDGGTADGEEWAAIRVIMPGNGNTHMTFSTTASDGETNLSEKMRITDAGAIHCLGSTDFDRAGLIENSASTFNFHASSSSSYDKPISFYKGNQGNDLILTLGTDLIATFVGQITCGSDIINNGNLYSSGTSGTHYCGLSNQRWHTVYGVNSNFSSDQTLKKNIATSDLGIDFIKSLNPVKFNWKKSFGDDTKQHYGFLAQEIKETPLEDSVDGEEGEMGMNYNELIAPMVKAIQELSAEVEKLKENA